MDRKSVAEVFTRDLVCSCHGLGVCFNGELKLLTEVRRCRNEEGRKRRTEKVNENIVELLCPGFLPLQANHSLGATEKAKP